MGLSGSKEKSRYSSQAASSTEGATENKPAKGFLQRTEGFVHEFLDGSLEQLSAAPTLVRQLINNPSYRKPLNNYFNVFLSHFLMVMFLESLNVWFTQWLMAENETEEDGSTLYYFLCFTTWLAVMLYNLRDFAPAAVQTFVTNLQLSRVKNRIAVEDKACGDKKCQPSTISDMTTIFVNNNAGQALSKTINYLPFPKALQWLVFVWVNGIYIAENSRRPEERCEHRVPSTGKSLSLGLAYWGTSSAMEFLFSQTVIKLPFYHYFLLELMLLNIHVAGARHLNSLYIKQEERNVAVDPIVLYGKFSNELMVMGIEGIKARLPFWLKNDDSSIAWGKLFSKINQLIKEYPFFQSAYGVLMPKMLTSVNNFIHDPVIASFWPNLRKLIVGKIDEITRFEIKHPILHKLLCGTPKTVLQNVAEKGFGVNKKVTGTARDMYFDEKVHDDLTNIRSYLVSLKLNSEMGELLPIMGEDEKKLTRNEAQDEVDEWLNKVDPKEKSRNDASSSISVPLTKKTDEVPLEKKGSPIRFFKPVEPEVSLAKKAIEDDESVFFRKKML